MRNLLVASVEVTGFRDKKQVVLEEGRINIVDIDTGQKTLFATGLGQVYGLAYAPNGDIWAASFSKGVLIISPDGTVTRLRDGDTGPIPYLSGIPVYGANGIAFGPDGTCYLSCYNYGNIGAGYILAIAPNRTARILASGLTGPGGLMVDNGRLLITGYGGFASALWSISLVDGTVSSLIPNANLLPWGLEKATRESLLIVNGGSAGSGKLQELKGNVVKVLCTSKKIFSAIGAVKVGDELFLTVMNDGKLVKLPLPKTETGALATAEISAASLRDGVSGLGYCTGVVGMRES